MGLTGSIRRHLTENQKTNTKRSWCLPNGTFLNVPSGQHGPAAAEYLKVMPDQGMASAFRLGWVRCIVDGSRFCVYSIKECPWTFKQTGALFDEAEARGLILFDDRTNRDLTK